MLYFHYDVLLDEESICNRQEEKAVLKKAVREKEKVVVYGERNSGKTSLVKNVIVPYFQTLKKRSFVLFADLMEVKNISSIDQRIRSAFATAFAKSFPAKNLVKAIGSFLTGLKANITLDPLTGAPTLSLETQPNTSSPSFLKIFETLQRKISKDLPVLVVLDEFQDIAFVPEAQGLMRQIFQMLTNIPIILMGSKQHILSNIFAQPNAPLAGFGKDIEFHAIAYEDYHEYILERFKQRELKLDDKTSVNLQDLCLRNPEAINIVCAHLLEKFSQRTVTLDLIHQALKEAVDNRRSRFEMLLSQFSQKQESVLVALANFGIVHRPTASDFVNKTKVTPRSAQKILRHFADKGIITLTKKGYQINDPLLHHFLKTNRS